MDTKPLERFCPWARAELIEAVKTRCLKYGLDDAGRAAAPADSDIAAGRVLEPDEKRQRRALYPIIEEMGYEAFCEHEAYTWFNRFVAIRFMELNGYLSNHVRMLSASDGSFDPECLRAVGEINLPDLDRDKALDLAAAGNDEDLFRLIILAQCNELAQALPNIFGQVKEADALTLPDGLKTPGEHNVLQHMVIDIPEVDENGERPWEHIEILGWMYQFYNAEVKAEFFKSKRKAEAKDIAPATQLFTPEWIVRYMVDNSLGRLWMLNFPDSRLRERATDPNSDERLMEYYIEPDEEHEDFIRISGPEEITFCDPACGSGHILVYAFKMLFAMYEERGYRSREIPELILTKNLSGIEIDERAAQIAELCLALCARKHDRRFFTRGIEIRIAATHRIDDSIEELPEELAETLSHLNEIGSLVFLSEGNLQLLKSIIESSKTDLMSKYLQRQLGRNRPFFNALDNQYHIVVANPPYMGSSSFNPWMSKRIKKLYPNAKSDLCTCFIERGYSLTKERGYTAMVTMQSWMFLGSFEKMREQLIDEKHIVTMAHLGPRAFDAIGGEVVSVTADVLFNGKASGKGSYIRLVDIAGSEPKRKKLLEAIQNPNCGYFYRADATTFHDIPGSPIAYWAEEKTLRCFSTGVPLSRIAQTRKGMFTGNNDFFLKQWHEVSHFQIGSNFMPYCKGGAYRKWYGNQEFVIRWHHNGRELLSSPGSGNINISDYFKPCICWSLVTSGDIGFRLLDSQEYVMGDAGPACYPPREKMLPLLGLLNSSSISLLSKLVNPTINWTSGVVGSFPIIKSFDTGKPTTLARKCVSLSKADWDSQETSWDFKRNALI